MLHVLAKPDGTTRYVDHMIEGAPESVNVQTFSWKRALTGRYDILHIHWPENLIRGSSRASTWAKRILFLALMLRLRLSRRPIVRTIHNVSPHEQGGVLEDALLKFADKRTDYFIRLNDSTPAPTEKPAETILHGHYRDRPEYNTSTPSVPNRILYFGLIRPYKGVEDLIESFREFDEPRTGYSLRIVGKPQDHVLKQQILESCTSNSSITARLEFLPDRDLAEEIAQAQLVVLPYREMHNSGSVLLALSMNRPVLVPATAVNRSLQQEVGPGWVYLFEGALDAADLMSATEGVANDVREDLPQLSGRDWGVVGERHRAVYERALTNASGHGPDLQAQ